MQLPGLERLALVPTAPVVGMMFSEDSAVEDDDTFNRIFNREQSDTVEAARIPVRGDWNQVPKTEQRAYRRTKALLGVFVDPPTNELEIIDEGLRYHGIPPLPPMTRLYLGEWLQGYFVDSHHHLHSPQLSSVHQEAYVTFWNDYLVPLAHEMPIGDITGFTKDDIDNLKTAIRNLKPKAL